MTALPTPLVILAWTGLLALGALLAAIAIVVIRYGPIVQRILEVRPVFLPLHVTPEDEGEPVTFASGDGISLAGSYLRRHTRDRAGVLVFCHEYLSDRWSYLPYADHLRDRGYDIFTFDFRNHGASGEAPNYSPLQWTTTYELEDLRAALRCLRAREDRDPAGFALIGVSRGGSTAIAVAAGEADVWGVITDGAFPIRGTMMAYILRWAEIYVRSKLLLAVFPNWMYRILASASRRQSERRLHCRFADIEAGARGLSPRPWLAIHGEKDAYIGPDIARELYDRAGQPKELWIVPGAKHNRCREADPEAYASRQRDFLARKGPRPLVEPGEADVEPMAIPDLPERASSGSRILPAIETTLTT
ncbi:alpha/beta hydrolase [Aquisphaera insulae]|uniref:alpha/beta hydrolase n=1 Tax=Aquisphaera insulae TaxID=2712864 RepID=UPI0013EBB68C|nr:alpha/beta fold hydrolase [Aquisphaera insulae]